MAKRKRRKHASGWFRADSDIVANPWIVVWREASPLRNWRIKRNMTRKTMAEKVGVELSSVTQWELGNSRASSRNTAQIALALRVPFLSFATAYAAWWELRPGGFNQARPESSDHAVAVDQSGSDSKGRRGSNSGSVQAQRRYYVVDTEPHREREPPLFCEDGWEAGRGTGPQGRAALGGAGDMGGGQADDGDAGESVHSED